MTRVLSGAVLVAVAIAIVWFAPQRLFEAFGCALTIAGTMELLALADANGLQVPKPPAYVAAAVAWFAVLPPDRHLQVPLDVALMMASIAIGFFVLAGFNGGAVALASTSVALFPSVYVALPIGALVAIRSIAGAPALFLLMLTVMVSDTAQYYSGRLFGRRPLAPTISPKKTVEGAVGGFVFGTAAFVVVGGWWAPGMVVMERVALGGILVVLGIAGDLFESMLKRSAGVKDSSALIPGHGGVLDRIDALLFAAPVYYVVLKYV